jgi:hypothetical protein
LKKKKSIDNKQQRDAQQKSRRDGMQRIEEPRKNREEQRRPRKQEHGEEAGEPEVEEQLQRHPLLEAIQASVDKLDVVSIAAGQPVVELAAGSGEGCGDEGGV